MRRRPVQRLSVCVCKVNLRYGVRHGMSRTGSEKDTCTASECVCVCKVNLRYGVRHGMSRTGSEKDTCTACAGSMLLEFSALSRLTGNFIFEVSTLSPLTHCQALWSSASLLISDQK